MKEENNQTEVRNSLTSSVCFEMHARGVATKWQSRRKISLGPPVRKACPASGATWNVQGTWV